MPDEERMTIEERYKYLRGQQRRYRQADRAGKGRMLDEMEVVTGLHRKSLVRLMGNAPRRKRRSRGRGPSYGQAVRQAVLVVAESLDWICAERLTPSLGWMARLLLEQGELELSEAALMSLEQISTSSVRRILGSVPKEHWRLPRKHPRPNPIARRVSVERIPWDILEPGHIEVDLVHHGGRSTEGEYLHTLQAVDVASGWSERVVVVGRSFLAMSAALDHVIEQLPFPLLEVHCDNGAEFLNYHLLRFWAQRCPGVKLSRSRPYHKNDNRFVEQKNSSLVRAYIGYQRLDSPHQAQVLSQLYRQMRLYHNLFFPVQHQVDKCYITEAGGKTRLKRRRGRAITPLDQAIALGAITGPGADEWLRTRRSLNPRRMREHLYALLEQLRALPAAGTLGDVRKVMASLNAQAPTPIPLPQEAALAR